MTDFDSQAYWEGRYLAGGTSGAGSYGDPAQYKADFLNTFVREHAVGSVVEFGCGDGAQLRLAEYPSYVGLDVSPWAVERCREIFADDVFKQFRLLDSPFAPPADLALSLDVIYHLIEDDVYEAHMTALFRAATRFVIVYADVTGGPTAPHCRWRDYPAWAAEHAPTWRLLQVVPKPVDDADYQAFHVYAR